MKLLQRALSVLFCVAATVTGQQPPNNATRELSTTCGGTAEVTIVGGGLAGIYAALVLQLRGISYHLLEYSDKWGGRLHSFESNFMHGGSPLKLERGAQFMYGKNNGAFRQNPIWRLFENFDISTFNYDVTDWATYRQNGRGTYDERTVRRRQRRFLKSVSRCLDRSGDAWFEEFLQGIQTPDVDAETLLETCTPPRFQWENDRSLKTAVSHVLGGEIENALPLNKISRAAYPEDSFATFGPTTFFQFDQEGSSSVIEQLVGKLDDTKIQLEARVIAIEEIGGNYKTTAKVEGCGGDPQEFSSEFVIVAAPINIVKGLNHDNTITFDPPLENMDNFPIVQNEVCFLSFIIVVRLFLSLLAPNLPLPNLVKLRIGGKGLDSV